MSRPTIVRLERYGLLVLGLVGTIGLYPLAVWFGVGANPPSSIELGAVVVATIPIILCTGIFLIREAQRSRIAERKLQKLNMELQQKEILLERLAMTAVLTGLYNRRYFNQQLQTYIAMIKRYQRPEVALLLLDFDGFKDVNDTHGHTFGDLALIQASRLLRRNLRGSDVISRYGGEEFTVLLPETGLKHTESVSEKLRAAFEIHEFTDGEHSAQVTISVGITAVPAPGIDTEAAFVQRADAALYETERQGRNRTAFLPQLEPSRWAN